MRIFRLIATPVILLGLLGLLIWGANWGWKALLEPLPSPSPTPCVMENTEMMNPTHVSVRVFNGGFTGGLANREGRRLTEAGFAVRAAAGSGGKREITLGHYAPAFEPRRPVPRGRARAGDRRWNQRCVAAPRARTRGRRGRLRENPTSRRRRCVRR